MKLATCLALAGMVAVTQAAALRKHDRATLQAVERIGSTSFGETLLLSVQEKMARQSPVEEILKLLDTIEDAILGEQKEELRRIEPQRKQCKAALKKLESDLASLNAHLSADDCTEHGSAALRASIADAEERVGELSKKKASREVEMRTTKAHVEAAEEKLTGRKTSHGKALDAVSRISDILSEMHGQVEGAKSDDVTALLEMTTQATETATELARKTQAALQGNDAEAVAALLSKLKDHLHGSLSEYKEQHEEEVKDWKDVLATQEAAIGAVDQEIAHLHDRIAASKARLAAAAAGTQQCLKEVERARADKNGRQAEVDAKRQECSTIDEAYERERSHRKDELEILEQVRAIVIDKLDAMGDFLRQRIRTVMGTGATGAAEAEPTETETAGAPVAATGAAADALEALEANEEDASDVPPGAMERMPADRYTATGTVEDVLHAQGSAGMGVAHEGPNSAFDAEAHESLPLGMDVVVASTGATGATGVADSGVCNYNYAGLTGPDFWQSLCGGKWAACNSRDGLQSPINVPEHDAQVVDGSALSDLALYHSVSGLALENDGNALVIHGNFGSFKVGAKTMQARRIVFRASSEHSFSGRYSHVEMQIHHQTDADNGPVSHAVVSVFLDRVAEGEQDSGLLWNLGFAADDVLPSPGAAMDIDAVRLGDFARSAMTGSYYRYTGSLTAPPCTANVEWFLVKSPLKVPAKWISAFEQTIDDITYPASGNNRPTQPIRSRIVELVEPSTIA